MLTYLASVLASNQARAKCKCHCRRAVLHVQLLEDVGYMDSYGSWADEKQFSDLRIGAPIDQQLEHLGLPRGERHLQMNLVILRPLHLSLRTLLRARRVICNPIGNQFPQ